MKDDTSWGWGAFALLWIVIVLIVLISVSSCGPTPDPGSFVQPVQVMQPTMTPVIAGQLTTDNNGAIVLGESDVTWERIPNPVADCSARMMTHKTAFHIMECVFIRCGSNPVMSCVGW